MPKRVAPHERPLARRNWLRSCSLAMRLTVLYVVSAATLLALIDIFLFEVLKRNLENEHEHFLSDQIRMVRRMLIEHPDDVKILRVEVEWKGRVREFNKFHSRLLNEQGYTLIETPGMSQLLPAGAFSPPFDANQQPQESVERRVDKQKTYLIMAAWAPVGHAGKERRIIQVALDWSAESKLLQDYRQKLIYVWAAGLLLSAAMGYVVTRRGMRPVAEMTDLVQRVQASHLHERIAPTGWPAELTTLAGTFDTTLDRLQESFERLSRFSADIAHELRTPLNNLRGEAEVALNRVRSADEYRQVLESSLEEYDRLARMVDSLLFLARAENPGTRIDCSWLDARREIEAVAEFHEAVAVEQEVSLICHGEAPVFAAPLLLRRAVSNLLSNALQYTGAGGRIELAVAQTADGTTLKVSDTGCGISAEHLPHIFDRFYRADQARSHDPPGTGLGLAMVKSITDLHGGAVSIRSQPGRGTTLTLQFPAPAQRPVK